MSTAPEASERSEWRIGCCCCYCSCCCCCAGNFIETYASAMQIFNKAHRVVRLLAIRASYARAASATFRRQTDRQLEIHLILTVRDGGRLGLVCRLRKRRANRDSHITANAAKSAKQLQTMACLQRRWRCVLCNHLASVYCSLVCCETSIIQMVCEKNHLVVVSLVTPASF